MTRAVLSIGSNLGDREALLREAVAAFRPWLVAVSPVYETAPWGGVAQQDFLNAVLVVDDAGASPREWLRRAHAAEDAAGRVRDVRWGPRTLDVDLVDIEGDRLDEPDLTLPHPRATERAFVLVPWSDVDSTARLDGIPITQLLAALETDDVRPRPDIELV